MIMWDYYTCKFYVGNGPTRGEEMSGMPWLIRFARCTYGRLLRAGGKVGLRNDCGADLKAGPYIYLFNHVGIMDPVMVSAVFPCHVRWVAGAYLFKNRFLKLVLGKGCGAIPKQQGRNDLSMARNIGTALKNGDNIGLFPEGTRTWDGEMMPIVYIALAKFVRRYNVPVVVCHLEGGYAHQPRWADHKRKGKVTVAVRHYLSAEELQTTQIDALASRLEEYMHFSNDEWKRTADYSYVCDRRAEGLQRLLYMCPKCNAFDSLDTSGNTITCRKCGAVAELDPMDDIVSSDIPFHTLREWHEWESSETCRQGGFPAEGGVLFQTGDDNDDGELKTISENITVQLKDDVLTVDCNGTDAGENHYDLPLQDITSLVLNAKQTMELFCGNVLYRIRLKPEANSLKYQEYYRSYRNSHSAADVGEKK